MYIGRFAPSPTGALHFGSLLAALASYLDAKSNCGLWLLRIDDLDPPREMPGASNAILETLEAFGLLWDQEVIYQSKRNHLYQQALNQLQKSALSYSCHCSRKEIINRTSSSRYDRHCLTYSSADNGARCAWRFKNDCAPFSWQDTILGHQQINSSDILDFILKRSDSLWAYQLATTVDDAAMGITHVLRGKDLLAESAKQQQLLQALHLANIQFGHIPLATNHQGQKLSKQNLAPPLSTQGINQQLFSALLILGQKPNSKLRNANTHDILQQAVIHWTPSNIPLKYTKTY